MPAEGRDDDVTPHDADPMGVRPYYTGGTVAPGDSTPEHGSLPVAQEIVPEPRYLPVPHSPRSGQELAVPPTAAGVGKAVAVWGGGARRRFRYLLPVVLTAAAAAVPVLVGLAMDSGNPSGGAARYVVSSGDPSLTPSWTGKPGIPVKDPTGKPSAGDSSAGAVPSGTHSALIGPSSAPLRLPGLPVGSARSTVLVATPQSSASAGTTQQASTAQSLESVNYTGRYVSVRGDDLGYLDPASSTDVAQKFTVAPGLADASCYSFMAADGSYLRHSDFRIHLAADDGTTLFQQDATFCAHAGAVSGSVAFESYNYPGRYLRHRDFELWIDPNDGTTGFGDDSSFRLVAPLG